MSSRKLYYSDGSRVSDLTVEQAVLGELDPERLAELRKIPGFDQEVRRRRAEDQQFFETHPPKTMIEQIEARASESPRKTTILPFPIMGGVAAAAVLVVLLAAGPLSALFTNPGAPTDQGIRSKGLEPSLHIFHPDETTPQGVRELEDRSLVSAFDTLQISYNAAGRRFGAIISIDGRQVVTLHHPEHYNATPELTPSGEVLLPYAYQIDDAPDLERFYLITAAEGFDLAGLLDRVKRQAATQSWLITGELELGEDYQVEMITLRKE
ncbi:hypothetical protein [Spirochaeta lutea]|uniref:hypothetical protein n=1 Tax=Spirochaeta lutea TaxID=1480694 RepID=UPI00068FC59F|nr:hypothetical protein [Spirochaeta lutea]